MLRIHDYKTNLFLSSRENWFKNESAHAKGYTETISSVRKKNSVNPLNPIGDQDRVSPYNVNTI